MFIRARSVFIRPDEEIKFKRANFYLDGSKVLSVPLHVEPLRGGGTGLNRALTYGTDGLRLDIPFYYSLTANGTGALRLKHAQDGGWGYYSGPSGWQLNMEQEYNSGGSTEGLFALNRITSGEEWGARWSQRAEFENDSQLYTYVDFPAHRSLFGSADYSRRFGDYTMSLNLRGDKVRNSDGRYSTYAYVQSRPKSLFSNAVNYSVTSRLSYSSYLGGDASKLGGGLGLQLYGKPLQFGAANLSTSLSVNHDLGGAYPGTSINANVGYYRMLGNIGTAGVNYSYSSTSSAYGYSAQRISTDLSLAPSDRWRAYFYGTYGIGDKTASAFAELSYVFLPTWRVDLLGTFQKFGDFRYNDFEVALAKAVGRQEGRLIWSQARRRIRFEFSALSF
jgi:hypothetical protein